MGSRRREQQGATLLLHRDNVTFRDRMRTRDNRATWPQIGLLVLLFSLVSLASLPEKERWEGRAGADGWIGGRCAVV